jgi:serine/threonine-protein kinase HipA
VISFPFATRGKRWILKLNPADKPLLIENEHFFMKMAKQCGLDVAPARLVRDREGAAGLLVERFDRQRVGGHWRGLHQEDACQLLNRYPADKYRLSTADVAGALGVCASPLAERLRLIELVAFSYLVGNGDLHGKNVSVLERSGTLQLSPAYDLLSTRPYGDRHLAVKLEGRDVNLKRKDLLAFGARHAVPPRAVEATLDGLTRRAKPFLSRIPEIGFDARKTALLVALMKKRLEQLER